MSAATATPAAQQVQPAPYGDAVKKITSIPVVSESISYAQSTINAYPLLTRTYNFGESVFNSSLKAAEPVTTRIQPQLKTADKWAVQSLEFAESKVPYPFHATTNDFVSQARAPADQVAAFVQTYADAIHQTYEKRFVGPAKNLYSSRVAPAYDSAQQQFEQLKSQNSYVKRSAEIISNLQNKLSANLESISSAGKEASADTQKRAQNISGAIFAELERVRGFALSLPAESRKRYEPVLATFTDAYEALRKEASDSNTPVQARLQKVVNYVSQTSVPALRSAIVNPDAATSPNGVASKQ